jgi:hypothetical protein
MDGVMPTELTPTNSLARTKKEKTPGSPIIISRNGSMTLVKVCDTQTKHSAPGLSSTNLLAYYSKVLAY